MRRAWIGWGLLLAACAGAGPVARPVAPPPARPQPVPDLELRALLLLLVDRQTWEPYIVDRARAGRAELRAELAMALGRAGDPRGLAALRELAVDPDTDVRRAAVLALGEIGEELARRGEGPATAERALLRAVGDPDRTVGELAVEALAKAGAGLAVAVSAGQPLEPDELEQRLLPALWRFAGREMVRWAERGLARGEPELRAHAAHALARTTEPEAAPLLRGLLADPDPQIRAWAARGLGRLGSGADLARLRPLLEDPEPGPRIRALGAAARLVAAGRAAPPGGWREPLVGLLAAPHRGVRLAAIAAAAAWLLDEELGDRLAALAAAADPAERRAALTTLAAGGEPRALALALSAAGSTEPADRAAAAVAAGLLDDAELLARLAADPDAGVRQAAVAQLLSGGGREAALDAALTDPDPGVRATALERLVDEPSRPMLELLVAAAGDQWAPALAELPLAGIAAMLARARAVPEEVEAAAFALERYAAGDSHLLRRAAGEALVELGRSRPPVGTVATGRQTADYEEIVRRTWSARRVELLTRHGPVTLGLDCRPTPLTCLNFLQLVGSGFYDGLAFHRVVPDFVVQGGDPRGDGRGGPGYTIRDEIGLARFTAGTLGMALAGADTGGSQFFVTLSPQPHLDGGFTAFGRVIAGWQALAAIGPGDRILAAREVG